MASTPLQPASIETANPLVVLRITLPTAQVWNTWFTEFGNRAEGFARLDRRVTEIAGEVGRDPSTVERSACVLVVLDPSAGERPVDTAAPAITGPADTIVAALRDIDRLEAVRPMEQSGPRPAARQP